MDLINADGSQVVTPTDRTFSVWRGVPTVENTFYAAPYQYDGRFPTFPRVKTQRGSGRYKSRVTTSAHDDLYDRLEREAIEVQ